MQLHLSVAVLASLPLLAACSALDSTPPTPIHDARTLAPLAGQADPSTSPPAPVPGAINVDHLIESTETHFEHLWMLSNSGENAEAYWSFAGDRLVMQHRNEAEGIGCDRIFVSQPDGSFTQVSNGRGATTCAYFMPGDDAVLFASTHSGHTDCPPRPDPSRGYVWAIYPEYDIYRYDLESGVLEPLIEGPGYDAEATVSPLGDRLVFTSTRSGDVELWTANIDGSDPFQVTDTLGYDGGAFFSHDGQRLVFRTTAFDPENLEEAQASYSALVAQYLVRPSAMEIMVIDTDGQNRRQVTDLGGANWAPYFYPDDQRIVFCTNHHAENRREPGAFDLFAIGADGTDLERITTYPGFDSFPMFSPDGKYLVFASNRGNANEGDTNVFIAAWR